MGEMSLAFLSPRSNDLRAGGVRIWGYDHRRALSQTFADDPTSLASCFPERDSGIAGSGGAFSGGAFGASKAAGQLLPAPDNAVSAVTGLPMGHPSEPQPTPASQPGSATPFTRPSTVLQNMVPVEYPKRLSLLAASRTTGSFAVEGRAMVSCSEWLVTRGLGTPGQGKASSDVDVRCDGAESPMLGFGAKQHSLYKVRLSQDR